MSKWQKVSIVNQMRSSLILQINFFIVDVNQKGIEKIELIWSTSSHNSFNHHHLKVLINSSCYIFERRQVSYNEDSEK